MAFSCRLPLDSANEAFYRLTFLLLFFLSTFSHFLFRLLRLSYLFALFQGIMTGSLHGVLHELSGSYSCIDFTLAYQDAVWLFQLIHLLFFNRSVFL